MAEDKDIVTEEHDGGKFEFHQHGGGHKMMEGMMNKYSGNELVWPLVFGVAGYWLGSERHEGHRGGRGHGRGDDDGCCYATKSELMLVKELGCKDAIIAEQKAEKFTLLTEGKLAHEICGLKAEIAAMKAGNKEIFKALCKEDDDVRSDIKAYVDANFIKGQLVLPSTPTVTGIPSGPGTTEEVPE